MATLSIPEVEIESIARAPARQSLQDYVGDIVKNTDTSYKNEAYWGDRTAQTRYAAASAVRSAFLSKPEWRWKNALLTIYDRMQDVKDRAGMDVYRDISDRLKEYAEEHVEEIASIREVTDLIDKRCMNFDVADITIYGLGQTQKSRAWRETSRANLGDYREIVDKSIKQNSVQGNETLRNVANELYDALNSGVEIDKRARREIKEIADRARYEQFVTPEQRKERSSIKGRVKSIFGFAKSTVSSIFGFNS